MSQPKETPLMEKIVSLCKRRGFIFQSSEIYGGINGFWDYGPLGAELKRNLRDTWWRAMTREREDVVGLDATIIMHPAIWKASGHVDTFSDPMSDCLADEEALPRRSRRSAERDGHALQRRGRRPTGWKLDRACDCADESKSESRSRAIRKRVPHSSRARPRGRPPSARSRDEIHELRGRKDRSR